jgi:CBS domain-containing protein
MPSSSGRCAFALPATLERETSATVFARSGLLGTSTETKEAAMATLVRHAMSEAPKALDPTMVVSDAAGIMANYDVGAVPVVEGGRVIGMVTDRDIVTRVVAARKDASEVCLGDIATTSLVEVSPDMDLVSARDLMAEHRIRRLPVVKDDQLVGILSLGDVALASASKRAVGETLVDVSESERTMDLNDGPDVGTPGRARMR